MVWRRRSRSIDSGFVGARYGEEIAPPDNVDRSFRSAAQRRLVDRSDRSAPARLPHDTGMHHAVLHHVMKKDRLAKHLGPEVDASPALPDDAVAIRRLGRRPALRMAVKIDGSSERPVVVPGPLTTMDDRAVVHRQIRPQIAEGRRGVVEKQALHFGASEA